MMELYDTRTNERGVSESIGFLLIFTIVIAGIGLVTLYGYPLLLQQQVSADEKIMEKNMIVLQNDFKSLAYKTVPFKETSLKIGGGSLTVYNSSYNAINSPTLNITYTGCPTSPCVSFKSGELRYESVSAQTDISLQNGAVVMRPRIQPGSTMLAEPRWFYDKTTQTMVINLINITSDNIIAKEGIGTVRMKLGETNYYPFDDPAGGMLTIRYTPETDKNTEVAWRNYFTNSLKMGVTGPDYTLTNIKKLVIKKYEVKIEAI